MPQLFCKKGEWLEEKPSYKEISNRRNVKAVLVFKKRKILKIISAFKRIGIDAHKIPKLICEPPMAALATVVPEYNKMLLHIIS